ncbi:Two-component sensor histidine kinase, contains HisKA and HATPase domains [Devosia enhydra]|uniref:histidine kinase n=1 Tax=Devosia enhydra TaxID=665118 RepID=A0A1K2I222_9HYPH|nr:histidine kinase dimerization/phosphoacceptor domain -containing protein [Devosia enhydra]SFZ86267.1 Two-component sensor histidine kinase, contains HisKA and HATPase domains [Devosia enhydra]
MDTGPVSSRLFGAAADLRQRPRLGYAIAVSAFLIALLTRFGVNAFLPSGFPYLTFFPAVLLTAFFCGTGPGLLAALLSVAAAWYWFIPPLDSFALDVQSGVAVLFFVAILSADLLILHIMHSALADLRREQARSRDLLEQQKTLFAELQHRTANNMAFISALLSMHKRKAKDQPEVVAAFESASGRLDTMARVHRRLYDPTSMDMPVQTYLRELLADVIGSSGREGVDIVVDCEVAHLDVNRLTTVSLIVSELAVNAAKHAFDGRGGRLEVSLLRSPDGGTYTLRVRDDGPGFPDGFDPSTSDRLGFRVLNSFARSLNGQMAFRTDGGAVTEITFPAKA